MKRNKRESLLDLIERDSVLQSNFIYNHVTFDTPNMYFNMQCVLLIILLIFLCFLFFFLSSICLEAIWLAIDILPNSKPMHFTHTHTHSNINSCCCCVHNHPLQKITPSSPPSSSNYFCLLFLYYIFYMYYIPTFMQFINVFSFFFSSNKFNLFSCIINRFKPKRKPISKICNHFIII